MECRDNFSTSWPQRAVAGKGKHVEACNKLCEVARWRAFHFAQIMLIHAQIAE